MGLAESFPMAFLKAQLSASGNLPDRGRVFVSVRDEDKAAACEIAQRLVDLGFQVLATGGTKLVLDRAGVPSELVNKVREGRPHIVDRLRNGDVAMVVNTTEGAQAIRDSYTLRRQTLVSGMPYFTTIAAAAAAVGAIEARREAPLQVRSLQEYHASAALHAAKRPSFRPT